MKTPKVWDCPTTTVVYEYENERKLWIIVSKFEFAPTPNGYIYHPKPEIRYCVGITIQAEDDVTFFATFGAESDAFKFVDDVRHHRGRFVTEYSVPLQKWVTDWKVNEL